MRALTRAALLLALVLVASVASAHEFPVERSAVLQVHTAHAELLLVYREPPGPRTRRILALYDTDQNGEIDGIEAVVARRAFLARAFAGLEIGFDAKSASKTAELRFRREKDGGLAVAILQRIDLVIGGNRLLVKVDLAPGNTVPLQLIVEPASGWRIAGQDAKEKQQTLTAGAKFRLELQRSPALATEPAPAWKPNLPE